MNIRINAINEPELERVMSAPKSERWALARDCDNTQAPEGHK